MPKRSRRPSDEQIELPTLDSEDESTAPDAESENEPAIETLAENTLPDLFTSKPIKATDKEQTLQNVARTLLAEYHFALEEMARDVRIQVEVAASDGRVRRSRRKADIVVYEEDKSHDPDNIIRICVIASKGTRGSDSKNGVQLLEDLMGAIEPCEFGLWTNGEDITYLQKDTRGVEPRYEELADFPGKGETLDDLGERRRLRVAAGPSLLQTFKRCHDYIYGNQGLKKDAAFWELLNLNFCKIYDERHPKSRRFWVGVKERNSPEGQHAIAQRIRELFEDVKKSDEYRDVFDPTTEIRLNDRVLAFLTSQLARYSMLQTTIDVKGAAYEEITSHTLKAQRGQFFTPRNIVRVMVEMLDPGENDRILDPACGSGGFLVFALDHVREKIISSLYPKLTSQHERIERKEFADVVERVRKWANSSVFGIDFDPDLKRAARMNMVMNNDGHGNIYSFNSLEFPNGSEEDVRKAQSKCEFGTMDFVFTNPPFGTKIPIDEPTILHQYELARRWHKNAYGDWITVGTQKQVPPEILFVEQCYNWLKPGSGKMAIVLPDGILGNPGLEYVRAWILKKMQVLASIDLPVEAFLPQVGVQASLLFLRRKSEEELAAENMGHKSEYSVFMAVAEKVGKDRRGNPVFVRDADGAELTFETLQEEFRSRNGRNEVRLIKVPEKRLDDDLPRIRESYLGFLSRPAELF